MAVAVTFGACDDDPVAPVDPPQTREERIQAVLQEAVGELRPGVALQVRGGGLDFFGTAGVTEEGGAAWGENTTFHAASVGKAFVGLTMATLVERGHVDLSDPLTMWLPVEITARIPSSSRITLDHLLHHTSGIVDVLNEMTDAVEAFANDPGPWENTHFVQFALDQPLNFEPGSAFRYSNTNYMLAGMVIEAVTGNHYASALDEIVFGPLGMGATVTSNRGSLATPPVHGYLLSDGSRIDSTPFALLWGPASGGQWTTTADLTRFIRGVFESNAVSANVRALITEGSAWAPYGLGMGKADTQYGTMHGHDGLVVGYATHVSYFPDSGVSIVLAANGTGGGGTPLDGDLFNEVLEAVFAD